MPEPLARILLGVAAVYLAAGLLFSLPFLLRWAGRLDPAAQAGSTGFRVLMLPGVVLLWPLLVRKLARRPAA